MRLLSAAAAVLALASALACSGDKNTYTLYRNGEATDTLRVHVATFDAKEEAAYNRDNCEQARELFQLHPAARSRFWCEQGRFRTKRK